MLLAENDPQVRQLMAMVLEGEGLNVLSVASGSEALAVSRRWSGQINLLVTDVVMGEAENGFALADQLRRERPGIAVLVVSSTRDSEQLAEQRGLAFLAKPFTPAALLKRVRCEMEIALAAT